ncbi:TRAP transporter small permease [Acuticoccus sp.]|uniref:TRAP transporter small permease n=1 Tax=Acuticoccus sp. TaxID=1904378 RepID=UPI003B519C43
MVTLIERASALAARASAVLIVAMTAACMGSLVLQVVMRYFVGQATSWTEELALFLFTWIVLLAGSLGVREGFHVRLTLLVGALPAGLRRPLERLTSLLVLAFGLLLVVSGVDYVDRTLGQVSAAVRFPIELLHAAAPVAGALVALHALARLLGPATAEAPALGPPPEEAR